MLLKLLPKITAAAIVVTAAAGCATVPGDPYYSDGYAPTPIYGGAAVYDSGGYTAYPAYPVVVRRDRDDRWEDMRNDRERRAWREREAARQQERERWERDQRARKDIERQRDQRRDWERQRDRDLSQRDRERRDFENAQRERAERARAARNDRNADGTPRTDYDRYNPKTGAFMKRSEDMP